MDCTKFSLDFFKRKVLDYQKKKLVEAEANMKNHSDKLNLLKCTDSPSKEIENEEKLVQIWKKNVEKINQEIRKLEKKS